MIPYKRSRKYYGSSFDATGSGSVRKYLRNYIFIISNW